MCVILRCITVAVFLAVLPTITAATTTGMPGKSHYNIYHACVYDVSIGLAVPFSSCFFYVVLLVAVVMGTDVVTLYEPPISR